MTLPKVMSRYLLMTAAIISVPPVLPLAEKAMPMPLPQKEAPNTHGKVSVLNRESGSEINNRGNARYSTGGDVVRKQEESPSDAVKDHSQGNH